MKKIIMTVLSITCFFGEVVSFFYLTLRNRDIIGEYYAQSSVNVELDRNYALNIVLVIETSSNP
jgi:hypothetical protein